MQLLIINPNTTAEMTSAIGLAAGEVALADTEITSMNPQRGPVAIQGAADGEAALPGLFALFDEQFSGAAAYDAIIIACFDDTGLENLKNRSPVPVLGIGEAAFQAAMMLGARFSVVTTLAVSVPVIEANIARYGFRERCAGVRASDVPVLETQDTQTEGKIRAEALCALDEDACDVIVLGCAGMAHLAREMSAELGVPVIDGVAAAVGFCESLHRLRRVRPASTLRSLASASEF